ncbi:GGDEF domain-containing protein [Rhizobacter sp. AJA081-3]|uniref:GGDEF domain-containing protein n=1 Tax=Rhizobacter sp. AJA081-3 TaxID=2753607 RepID=UPI001ADF322E|nr:GGDEF domain-containing protein [Rhizobacter sp. AJA081-3]QTN21636.1 GGDEF domain-containing protein [Rhizobacter sp. AJA081-3]
MIPSPAPDVAALIERALGVIMADGEAAAILAGQVLASASADAEQRLQAICILALFELREGTLEAGIAQLEAARAAHDPARCAARTGWLIEHVQTQQFRREGRLADAQAGLRLLHLQAEQRPAVDAYLSAGSLGVVLSMQGDNDGTLDLFYQALAIARRSGVDSLVVNALNNLGSFQSDLYNLEDARPLLEECLAGAQRVGSRRQTIYAAGNLVQCLCLMGRPAEALVVAREHLMGKIRADDLPALHRDEEIAQALLDNSLVDEAQAALGGEVHIDPMSNELATARVWLGARILLARGQAGEALRLCLARQALLRQQGEESTVAIDRVNLLRVAAQAAGGVGDHALAYRLLDAAFRTHEALLGRAARSRQISLQISHRLQQAEWERDSAQQLAGRLETLNASLRSQVAENERLQERLRAQALEDPLTGLHNRRHLFEAGGALLALLRRRVVPLAAALVDLDHFKQVNDRHGHDAGDRVLRGFAELARSDTRAEDIVCRYGGEEFVLLFPGADAPQAAARLRDLLQRFQATNFEDASGGSSGISGVAKRGLMLAGPMRPMRAAARPRAGEDRRQPR